MTEATPLHAVGTPPAGPEIVPQPPYPEEPPITVPRPEVGPDPELPEEEPRLPDADVGVPPPQPDLPAERRPAVMAALLAALCLALGAPAARAQEAAEPAPLPDAPAEVREGAPIGEAAGPAAVGDELSRSGGVLGAPEATTDPGIVRPAPGGGEGTGATAPR